MTDLVQRARKFAVTAHARVNQTYDGHPYSYHLAQAAYWAKKFAYLLPEEKRETAIAGAWVHDTIEDAHQSYNDVKKALGVEVAEIAFALTNEKGRTRAERANAWYYAGIREDVLYAFVKLCDRLANASNSVRKGSRMADMYRKEFVKFREGVLGGADEQQVQPHLRPLMPMVNELASILGA